MKYLQYLLGYLIIKAMPIAWKACIPFVVWRERRSVAEIERWLESQRA